jgi:hypothetical protein
VDRNVDFVVLRYLFQALVEVLHITDKKRSWELKVSLLALIIINYMNHYAVLETNIVHSTKHRGTSERKLAWITRPRGHSNLHVRRGETFFFLVLSYNRRFAVSRYIAIIIGGGRTSFARVVSIFRQRVIYLVRRRLLLCALLYRLIINTNGSADILSGCWGILWDQFALDNRVVEQHALVRLVVVYCTNSWSAGRSTHNCPLKISYRLI